MRPGSLGIFADDRKVGAGHAYLNNTIIEPGEDGVVLYMDEATTPNRFQNNLVVNPGNGSYLRLLNSNVNLIESHNLFAETIAELMFTNPAASDFSLTAVSPAVDQGTNLTTLGVTSDRRLMGRPQGEAFDIGAFEYAAPVGPLDETINLPAVLSSID